MERKGFTEATEKALLEAGFVAVERSDDQSTIHAVYSEDASVGVNLGLSRLKEEDDLVHIWARAAIAVDVSSGDTRIKALEAVNGLNSRGYFGTWYLDDDDSIVVDHTLLARSLDMEELVLITSILASIADQHDDKLVEFLGSGATEFGAMARSLIEGNI